MQEAVKNCYYPELAGEHLRLDLNVTLPLEHVIESVLLGKRMFSVEIDKFDVVGKNI